MALWITVVSAFGFGALGAAIVQVVGGALAGRAQRQHEADIRQLDRDHELRSQQLADERARRDHREARVYTNLVALADLMLNLGARVEGLQLHPARYRDSGPGFFDAMDLIAPLRASIVLDAETEPLLRQVKEAETQYREFLADLETWQTARPGVQRPDVPSIHEKGSALLELTKRILTEARQTLEKTEAAR